MCGRRLAPGMLKRKLLIALAVAGLLTAAVGPSTLPAGAASHVITLKLLTGQLLTVQIARRRALRSLVGARRDPRRRGA